MHKVSNYEKITNEILVNTVSQSVSIAELVKKLSLSPNIFYRKKIAEKLEALRIDTTYFFELEKQKRLESYFKFDINYKNADIKNRFIKLNFVEYKCHICDICDWQNTELTLQLDHIDGNNRNNLLDNLRLLCPNCHSQTPTWRRRNKNQLLSNKIKRPKIKGALEDLLKENTDCKSTRLKARLLFEGIFKYHCVICFITNWNSRELILQMDHINGNNRDNRLDNLRLLCSNCHSQTPTFSVGKKWRKIG